MASKPRQPIGSFNFMCGESENKTPQHAGKRAFAPVRKYGDFIGLTDRRAIDPVKEGYSERLMLDRVIQKSRGKVERDRRNYYNPTTANENNNLPSIPAAAHA